MDGPSRRNHSDEKKYTIFVSSTQKDLAKERSYAIEAILRSGHIPITMEYFPATDKSSWSLITSLIDDCDYVICLVAGRYGFVAEGEAKSYSEREYDYAIKLGKPIIPFLHDALEMIPVEHRETSEEKRKQLDEFRTKIRDDQIGKNAPGWNDEATLVMLITTSLNDLFRRSPATGWVRAIELEKLRSENDALKKKLIAAEARNKLGEQSGFTPR